MQLRERKEILMLIWSMVDHCVNEIHKNSSIYAMTFVKHCLPKFGEYVHLILFSRQVEGIGSRGIFGGFPSITLICAY